MRKLISYIATCVLGFAGFVFGVLLDEESGIEWHALETTETTEQGSVHSPVPKDGLRPENYYYQLMEIQICYSLNKEDDKGKIDPVSCKVSLPIRNKKNELSTEPSQAIYRHTKDVPDVLLGNLASSFMKIKSSLMIYPYQGSMFKNIEDAFNISQHNHPNSDFDLKAQISNIACPSDIKMKIPLYLFQTAIFVNFKDLIQEIVDLNKKLMQDVTNIDEAFKRLCTATNEREFERYENEYYDIIDADRAKMNEILQAHFKNPEVSNIRRLVNAQARATAA